MSNTTITATTVSSSDLAARAAEEAEAAVEEAIRVYADRWFDYPVEFEVAEYDESDVTIQDNGFEVEVYAYAHGFSPHLSFTVKLTRDFKVTSDGVTDAFNAEAEYRAEERALYRAETGNRSAME
jgi:type II secretory pathway pseudopilin PulG